MQGPHGHKFLLCTTASNMMLSIDLAQSPRNGDKFRKSGPGLTVFPVKFCLQDFIQLIHVTVTFLHHSKGHISGYLSHHIIGREADFILKLALLHVANLLENVPKFT